MTPPAPRSKDRQKVFVDASSAILLYKANLFAGLFNLFQVVMAPSVVMEITQKGYPGAAYFKSYFKSYFKYSFNCLGKKNHNRSARILLQEHLTFDHPLFALKNFTSMDKGEKETIQIFCNLTRFGLPGANSQDPKTKDFILVDDGQAARFCQAQQIPFINSLLIPKIFWYSGVMDQKTYLEKTDGLCTLGRYSQKIMERARQFSQTDLSYFMERKSHG